jgi:hypothetical protein
VEPNKAAAAILVTHVFAGNYEVLEGPKHLVGQEGWFEIRLTNDGSASATAVDIRRARPTPDSPRCGPMALCSQARWPHLRSARCPATVPPPPRICFGAARFATLMRPISAMP